MEVMIKNGDGRTVKVTHDNRLKTSSISHSVPHKANHDAGESYGVMVSQTPTGAGDCFLYIKNTSETDLIITNVTGTAATDETVQIKLGDTYTTAVGGSTNTPGNRNAGSAKIADCTCETGNDITGLSSGTVRDEIYFDGANGPTDHNIIGDLIVPKNQVVSFYAVTGGIAIRMVVSIYFSPEDD